MARIVCQVLHRHDRISFLWSEGNACFEPYHLEDQACHDFLALADQIRGVLATSGDGATLARLGHQLYRALFRLDTGANPIHDWFAALARDSKVEQIEFLGDESARFPWNVLIDEVPAGEPWPHFWGARFNLGAGRRVNALRSYPVLLDTLQLFAADAESVEQLAEPQRVRLQAFRDAGTLRQSVDSFAGDLHRNGPDILLVLARFERGQLYLGPDAFGPADMQRWLQQATGGNADPLVILMGCGGAADQKAWQAFLSDASAALSGVIANEVLLPAAKVFALGLDFLQGFLQGHQSIGAALRTLRGSAGAAGLTLSAFCPPELHIAREGVEEPAARSIDLPLPASPYHPLAAYDASERPLFYGRQEETIACASLVDQAATRGVFLHGSPAAGKTSFLQAGLIPYLEQESVGYRLLRDRTPGETPAAEADYPVLVLRATGDLAGQFADALVVFCSQPFIYTTPVGSQVTVDLPGLLTRAVAGTGGPSTAIQSAESAAAITATPGETGEEPSEPEGTPVRDLWIALRDRKDLLAKILDDITRSLPFELVIAIDQGEELLTQVRTAKQEERRQKALDMLLGLSASAARCKMVFTVRSQNLGQLLSLIPHGRTPDDWRVFHLPGLSESKLVDALLWPTSRQALPYSAEVPFQKYGFAFEEGMAQQIVAQAFEAAAQQRQSPLSIVHAAGALLYEQQVLGKRQNVVRLADVKEFGSVREALPKWLERALVDLPVAVPSRTALRRLIGKLYTAHSDGTLSRDLVPAGELKSLWTGSPEPVEQVVNAAAEKQGLFDIQQLMIGGQADVFVSLSQDSLPQLARQIEQETRQKEFARTKVTDSLWIMIPLVFFAAALSFWLTRNYASLGSEEEFKENAEKKIQEIVEQADKQAKAFRETLASIRRPQYAGLLAQADQALQAGNSLRARQLLLSQPAMRAFSETAEKNTVPDMRGFEWRYLWQRINGERFALEGHRGIVTAAAISPDSKRAASASIDGTVRVWNLQNGAILALLGDPLKFSAVHAVAFAPDGQTVASAGADKTVRLWDISKLKTDYVTIPKETKALAGHTDTVLALAFGKDASTLASGGADKKVILWDIAAGKPKHTLKEHGAAVQALAIAGNTLVSAGAEAQVIVWDAAAGTKRQSMETPYHTVAALAFKSDGKTLATGGAERRLGADRGMIRFWDAGAGKQTLSPLQHSSGVLALAFDPKSGVIVSGGKDHVVRVWDPASSTEVTHWLGHEGWVPSLAFAGDGSAVVTGGYDQKVKVWTPGQPANPEVIQAHKDGVLSLAVDRKKILLASGSPGGGVKLWDSRTGKTLVELPSLGGAVTALAFSSDAGKTYLAAGTRSTKDEGEIKVWLIEGDAAKGYTAKETHALKKHTKGVTSLAFNPSPERAELLISGSADNTVILWDTQTGKDKAIYRGHKDEVRSVAFAPDGKTFASGGKDRQVCLYEVGKNDHAALADLHLNSIESIALLQIAVRGAETVSGLLTGSADQTVRLWAYEKLDNGPVDRKEANFFRSHVQPVSGVLYQNGLIVSSSWDHSIKLYDLFGERFTLLGHTGGVRAIALAPDQSFLASAGNDGTIRIWRAYAGRMP